MNPSPETCDGCQRVAAARRGENLHLIHEFPSSFLFLGDHQYFEGYCVLMLKGHVRELHEMAEADYGQLMQELRQASQAVNAAFKPWKLNHSCLGNAMPHIHWHIMPRYESDPERLHNPWFKMADFDTRVPELLQREALIAKIRGQLG